MPLKFALDDGKRRPFLDEPPHELLLLTRPLFGEGLGFAIFDLLHEEGEIGVLLEVARENLVIFGQKLLVVLLADQVALLLHQLHVTHVKLSVCLDLLDYSDEALTRPLKLST